MKFRRFFGLSDVPGSKKDRNRRANALHGQTIRYVGEIKDGVENVVGRECIAAPAATTNAAKHVEWDLGMRRMRPRRLVVKENGVAIFTELPDSPEQWLYSPDWDLVRLTVRGVDAAEEGARVGLNISGYAIRLR